MISGGHKVPAFGRAARIERTRRANERLDRAALERLQADALRQIVAHARSASPFYRDLYAAHGVDENAPLSALPPVDKGTLMADFDRWMTDRRVTLDRVRAELGSEDLLFGEFATMASGGSSRQPGAYVFDRHEWACVLASVMRAARWCGNTPRIPRRRLAYIHAPGTAHMAGRVGRSLDVGVYNTLRLSATMPRAEMVGALNAFQPTVISAYASVAALLAAEALDGRLRLSPSIVIATSEPVSAEMKARMREAWGVEPFDLYATTETGSLAFDCHEHDGLHVFEDTTIVEVVDADDRPVPDGEIGAHLLVTNLFNRTQPFIRYRLTDVTALEPGPCACGLSFRRLRAVEGRTDDLLEFPSATGGVVVLHPTAFQQIFAHDGAGELEVVQRGTALHVQAVPRAGADRDALSSELAVRAQSVMTANGCARVDCRVQLVDALARHPVAGKIKLIRRES
jgi:phenylacetate-CoA ligase